MEISVSETAGVNVVALSGEIDLQTSPKLRGELLGLIANKKPLVVEMSDVSYIDSSGVASLVEAFQTARSKNLGFSLAAIGDAPLRVLKLARLDGVFVIHDTLENAISANGEN
ncbi:MAG: STAS domain-containing protein [Rhodospirillaceae bacterium]|nr:STAS domain-containing protein [Rhodospirillaceae bacterium]